MQKKLIFLGTPEVAAVVLDEILKKARQSIQIIACVTQPPKQRSQRGQQILPSPVHLKAIEAGIPVLTPETCKEPDFLKTLTELKPDLCLTAAYGQILPQSFLSIPKFGTVNIHPSLLPRYRGAAPVQRSLEAGDKISGVTLLYTVFEMDSGAIINQQPFEFSNEIDSPSALESMFRLGARLFIKSIPNIFDPEFEPKEQDHGQKTYAKKLTQEESILSRDQLSKLSVQKIHNKIRAFKPWPCIKFIFQIEDEVFITKILNSSYVLSDKQSHDTEAKLEFLDHDLVLMNPTGILKIKSLQIPGRKVISGQDFKNALQGKSLRLVNMVNS